MAGLEGTHELIYKSGVVDVSGTVFSTRLIGWRLVAGKLTVVCVVAGDDDALVCALGGGLDVARGIFAFLCTLFAAERAFVGKATPFVFAARGLQHNFLLIRWFCLSLVGAPYGG